MTRYINRVKHQLPFDTVSPFQSKNVFLDSKCSKGRLRCAILPEQRVQFSLHGGIRPPEPRHHIASPVEVLGLPFLCPVHWETAFNVAQVVQLVRQLHELRLVRRLGCV